MPVRFGTSGPLIVQPYWRVCPDGALTRVGVARVEALVPQAEVDAIAPAVAARLRADLDAGAVAAAIRPAVPADAHFRDAAARREFAARESVHADVEVSGADQLFKHLRELGRIVGQCLDLLGGQGAGKRFIRRLRDDFDLFLDAGNLEFHAEVGAAAASHHDVRPVDRREPARLDAGAVAARRDPLEHRLAAVVGR